MEFFLIVIALLFLRLYNVVALNNVLIRTSLFVRKRFPRVPLWLLALVFFGSTAMLLGLGIKAISDEGDRVQHKDEPLAIVLGKPLEWCHVLYTNDTDYLSTVFGGDYPNENPKTTSLNDGLNDGLDGTSEESKLLNSLRKSTNFHTRPRMALGNSGYVVLINTGEPKAVSHPYIYFPHAGELGRCKEWCDVPPEFRQWMKTLKPRPSVPVPTPNREEPGIIVVRPVPAPTLNLKN